jgi:hypothetical protein
MDFESNWQAAMGGHLGYEGIANSSAAGGGGGGGKDPDESSYVAPKGYKPSTPDQRKRWNQFLDFLDKKGVGGSKDLDARDKALGKKYLEEYNKANPDSAIAEDFIPVAQYESYLIRRKNEFPGLTKEQGKRAFSGLSEAFRTRPISAVDSWLGSYTSKQYYPTFERVSNTAPKQSFGVSFEDYLKGAEALENPPSK